MPNNLPSDEVPSFSQVKEFEIEVDSGEYETIKDKLLEQEQELWALSLDRRVEPYAIVCGVKAYMYLCVSALETRTNSGLSWRLTFEYAEKFCLSRFGDKPVLLVPDRGLDSMYLQIVVRPKAEFMGWLGNGEVRC